MNQCEHMIPGRLNGRRCTNRAKHGRFCSHHWKLHPSEPSTALGEKPPGVFTHVGEEGLDEAIAHMDKITADWTMRAARMECSWICAGCSMSFPEGMPDACAHGHQHCTDIILQDKRKASLQEPKP